MLAVLVAAFLWFVGRLVAVPVALGHDESVYASQT